MKFIYLILILFVFLAQETKSQNKSDDKDSIISKSCKVLLKDNYEFIIASDYEDHQYLKIVEVACKDSCVRLLHDIYFRGGDCNATSIVATTYECKDSSIIFYTRDEWIEHFDDSKPHPHCNYSIENYQVNRLKEFKLIENLTGKEHSKVAKKVKEMLAR